MKAMVKVVGEKLRRKLLVISVAMMAMICSAVPAFASSGGGADDFVLTSADLDPVLNSIKANVKVVLPVMLIVLAIFLVIGLIPRLMKKGVHGG